MFHEFNKGLCPNFECQLNLKTKSIMNAKIILNVFIALSITTQVVLAQSLGYNNNRIAISADGNNQPDYHKEAKWPRADPDDWGGTPATLAIIAKLGLQDKLVHFSYNNFIAAPPHTSEINYMADGVNSAIKRWNFDAERFFDVPDDNQAAIGHLVKELEKSTATNPLYFIHMGPSEFFFRAVKQVVEEGNAENLSYVYVISHSGYNDNHLRRKTHHTMKDAMALSGDRIKYKKIKDQNGCYDPSILWCSGTDFSPFYWMRDHSDPDIQWLYSRMQFHPQNKGADISDAGMVWYLLKGDENGNLSKFKSFIGNGIANAKMPSMCNNITWVGVKDFEIAKLNNFVTPYKDNGRNAVAINAGLYKNKFAATKKVFNGVSHYYNITFTSLTEEDGESTYRLKINNKLIGKFQNPVTTADMVPYTQTFENILIQNGDVIQIESKTHSNGKIPEGDGFAFARGRWRSIAFECKTDCEVEEKDGLLVFEAERFELKGAWKLGKDTAKASGGEYVYFDGSNHYQNVNMDHVISHTFKINNPGNYTIKCTMRQPEGERGTDKGNDVWVYFSDDIGYSKDKQLKHFEKFYGRSGDDFTLKGVTELHGLGHGWLTAKFPKAGEYTLNIGGRSHGLQIDRLVFFKDMTIDQAQANIDKISETSDCVVIEPVSMD